MDTEKVIEVMSVKPEKDTTKVHIANCCSFRSLFNVVHVIMGLSVSLWASVLSAFPILYTARDGFLVLLL
jgi:hypothetical protein